MGLGLQWQILPHLKPQAFAGGADLLGAHCEGPWLNPLKKGAHGNCLIIWVMAANAAMQTQI